MIEFDQNMMPLPGVYENVPPSVYHSLRGLSSGKIKTIYSRTVRHYLESLNDSGVNHNENLDIGSAFHTLVLEPDKFWGNMVAYTAMKTRKNKDFEEFAATIPNGQFILLPGEVENIEAMAAAVKGNDEAMEILSQAGHIENTIVWNDPASGLLCRGRPDWYNDTILVDLKSAKDASPDEFSKVIANNYYYSQLAFYRQGLINAAGIYPERHCFIVCEKENPSPGKVVVYDLALEAIEAGNVVVSRAINKYLKYLQAADKKNAGGYESQQITIPQWELKKTGVLNARF